MSKINYYDPDTSVNLNNFGQDSAATALQAGLQGTTSVGYWQTVSVVDNDETITNIKPEDEKAKIIDILDKYGFEIVLNESGDLLGRKREDTIGWTYCGDLRVSEAMLSCVFSRVFTKATESDVDVEIEIIAKKDAFFEDINFILRPNYSSRGLFLSTYSILSNPIQSNLIIHLFPDQFFDSLKKAFDEIIDIDSWRVFQNSLWDSYVLSSPPSGYFSNFHVNTVNSLDSLQAIQLDSNLLTSITSAKSSIGVIKDADYGSNY